MTTLSLLAAEAHRFVVLAIPDPGVVQPPGTSQANTLFSYFKWVGSAVAVIGIMAVAIKFMTGSDRHSQDGAGALAKVAGGMILFGSAFGVAGAIMGG